MNFASAHDLKKQDIVACAMSWCRWLQTVTVYAKWGDDAATVFSSFVLPGADSRGRFYWRERAREV